jgi:hypothetical protein
MSGSNNVRGADNQQERLWICGWIVGVVVWHQLRTSKRESFGTLVRVLGLMEERKHLTNSGIDRDR